MGKKADKPIPADIRRGDQIIVIAGKDGPASGHPKRGKVIGAFPRENRLLVEGVNIIKRAVRRDRRVRQGGIIQSPGPIHRSNVMLVCPQCEKPTRISHGVSAQGKRVRVCKKCGKDID